MKTVTSYLEPDLDGVSSMYAYSIIYCNLDNTKKMVEKIFDVTFEGNIGKFDHVIQRKEMTKTIRDYKGILN